MTESSRSDVELRVLSQPRYLCVIRAAVEAMASRLGFTDTECGQIILVVDEAVTNVMRHGYQLREDGPITVRLNPIADAGREGIQITIEDECEGVDLARIRPRKLDDLRPGGLGTHIVHEVMDDARYSYRPSGRGVCLCMRKYRKDV